VLTKIKMKKKIILSAYACSPIRGSEPGNGWSWAINLAKLGHQVWCITNLEDKDIIISEAEKLGLNNLHFVFVPISFSLDHLLLNTSSMKIYFHYMIWRRAAGKVAQDLHDDLQFDIAHHVTFGSLQQGSFLWRLKNVNFVFGPVGGGQIALPAFKEYFGKSWKFEVLRSRISNLSFLFNGDLKMTLKLADSILVTNTDTENLVKGSKYYDPKRVHLVLDNAVPESMHSPVIPERTYSNGLKLLWVGRMMPRKGLRLVLHALSLLPKTNDYSLTIVGGGEQFDLVKDWIKEYKLDNKKIVILGQIPFGDVIEYYKTSEVFLFCSLRDSCPAQINEAMAFGLPAIVLDIHGSSLAVPNGCGTKVKVSTAMGTAKGIAEAIEELSNDKRLVREYSMNAYNYAKTNTWQRKTEVVSERYY
jgi:glycosyltransferase involved in cell wall biosynthesis